MKKIHLCIFNRASYSRCKSLIENLSKKEEFELTLLLSNSLLMEEYGNAQSYIKANHPNVKCHGFVVRNDNGTDLGACNIGSDILSWFSGFFSSNRPDAVIVIADRFETLPCAYAAALQNIPLVHIQGGEITGNIDEKIRHSVTRLADYHFCATTLARDYLKQMGEPESRIFYTGCPSLDIIHKLKIARTYPREKYILSIFHPETENQEEAFEQTQSVFEATSEFCRKYGVNCYWYWPNPDPGRLDIIRFLQQAQEKDHGWFYKAINEEPDVFLRKLSGAVMIIGNSSCGIRESSFMGVPAVNIGDRQRYRERGFNVIDTGYDSDKILKAMSDQVATGRYPKSKLYGDGHASVYIVRKLGKLDFTLKTGLVYPTWSVFRDRHFGEMRFREHTKRRFNAQSTTQS